MVYVEKGGGGVLIRKGKGGGGSMEGDGAP